MDGSYIGCEINGHGYQIYSELLFSSADRTFLGFDIKNSSINSVEW